MANVKPESAPKRKAQVQVATEIALTTKVRVGVTVGAGAVLGLAAVGFLWNQSNLLTATPPNDTEVSAPVPTTEERIGSLTRQLFVPDTASAALLRTAEKRAELLLALAETDPTAALRHVVNDELRGTLPEPIQGPVEQAVTAEGTLELLVFDDTEHRTARHELNLVSGTTRTRVFAPNPNAYAGQANAEVSLRGFQLDATSILLGPEDGSIATTDGAETTTTTATTTKKALVLLYNFANDTRQPISAEEMRSRIFTASNSVSQFVQETSFGKFGLTGAVRTDGDVLGYFTLPSTYDSTAQSCNSYYRTWSDAAKQAATAAGNDLSAYDYFFYVFPRPASPCPAWSWAEINGDETWNNDLKTNVLAHEFGHNLGATHASAYRCTDSTGTPTTLSTSCTVDEYGDPFDDMGFVYRQYHNRIRNVYGWLGGVNVQPVTASGTYTLYPVEKSHGSTQAIVINRNRNGSGQVAEQYWLEFRQPYGFDAFAATDPVVNGVTLRLAPVPGVGGALSGNTLLLDTTPSTTAFEDGPLGVGRVFEDTAYGIRFETLEVTADHATVRVDLTAPVCVPGTPSVALVPAAGTYGTAGQGLRYYLNVTNTDNANCPTSTFSVSPSLPTGWTQSPNPLTFTLAPGGFRQTALTVSSTGSSLAGVYGFSELVRNTTTNREVSVNGQYTVTGPDTTAPSVSITNPTNGSTVRGKNFKVSAYATDDTGIVRMEILVDATVVKTCTGAATCSGTFTLSKGAHTITVRATDASPAANVGSTSVGVTKR